MSFEYHDNAEFPDPNQWLIDSGAKIEGDGIEEVLRLLYKLIFASLSEYQAREVYKKLAGYPDEPEIARIKSKVEEFNNRS